MTIGSNVSLKNHPSATLVWPGCWDEFSFIGTCTRLYKYLFLVA